MKDLELELKLWYQSPLGTSLSSTEKKYFDKVLANISGDYALKFNLLNNELLNKCKALHRVYVIQNLSPNDSTLTKGKIIQCNFNELPFSCESIDLAIIPHILEFHQNPHLILEEIYHILAPNGKVIITGFNPSSLWNVVKYLKYKSANILPWSGRFIGQRRLKNWLTNLGFSIDSYCTFYFRPPINNSKILKGLFFMEKPSKIFLPQLGACYGLVAVKTVAALPPLQPEPVTKHIPVGV